MKKKILILFTIGLLYILHAKEVPKDKAQFAFDQRWARVVDGRTVVAHAEAMILGYVTGVIGDGDPNKSGEVIVPYLTALEEYAKKNKYQYDVRVKTKKEEKEDKKYLNAKRKEEKKLVKKQ